jgi:sorting nexin-25
MEFLDRRDRSLLVQFWLTVESFKNPLESVDSESDREIDPTQIPVESSTSKEDITMIYELYFSNSSLHTALSAISAKHVTAIRNFAASEGDSTSLVLLKARRSVLRAQRQVEFAMEQDFEEFQQSELWFRVLEGVSTSKRTATSSDSSFQQPVRPSSPVRESSSSSLKQSVLPTFPRSNSSLSFLHPRANTLPAPVPIKATTPETETPAKSMLKNLDLLMSNTESLETDQSRAPLFDDPEDSTQESLEKRSTVAAIQAALTDIIAFDNQQSDPRPKTTAQSESAYSSMTGVHDRHALFEPRRTLSEDSIDVLGEESAENKHENIQIAHPGDLQLSHEISRLSNKLSALETQDAMLDTLIRKADLAGDTQELRLLRKSKSALTREIRELSFQKTQYEQQDMTNRLVPERTKLSIVNSVQGDENGRAVVRYLVEVQQLAPDGIVATGWVVARRYNEFLSMHNKLRERFALVRGLEFPRKQFVTSLSATFVDARRLALEKYIQVGITSSIRSMFSYIL